MNLSNRTFSKEGNPLAMWNISRNTQELLWISKYFRVSPDEFSIRSWFAFYVGKIIVLKMFKIVVNDQSKHNRKMCFMPN